MFVLSLVIKLLAELVIEQCYYQKKAVWGVIL